MRKDAERLVFLKSRFYKAEAPGLWNPNIDLYLKPDQLIVEMEVPGVEPGDLQVSILNNILRIRGTKSEPEVQEGLIRYLCVERTYGRFYREIPLNCAVDASQAQAQLRDGVLTITLPRRKNRRGAEFFISVGKHGD